jgi:hypothetical protein
MGLADSLEPLTWDAAYSLVEIEEPDLELDELGELALGLERKISASAIVLLLTKADSDGFVHNLIRAAMVWQRYLERCRADERGTEDHNFCAGLFAPVLDALAAREAALARTLWDLGPTEHRPGHEIESDYWYARALFALQTGVVPVAETAAMLEKCAATGNAMSAARAAHGKTLLERDQSTFEDTFGALIRARENEIRANRKRGQVEDPPVLAHREVFVEGVALLNLAEQLGLRVAADYPMCPSLARTPTARPFPGLR